MELPDQELVRAALADKHAFSELVERYRYPLLRYIRRLGITDEDAATDILQETFIKTYVNLNDYDQLLSFSSWIYRITHNEARMYVRRQKNRPSAVQNESELSIFENLPDELNIFEEADAKLRSRRVAHLLGKLKQEYRDIIILRFFEEKSYDEISDILQIPPGTVATNLARGKQSLKQLLEQENAPDIYYGDHA